MKQEFAKGTASIDKSFSQVSRDDCAPVGRSGDEYYRAVLIALAYQRPDPTVICGSQTKKGQ